MLIRRLCSCAKFGPLGGPMLLVAVMGIGMQTRPSRADAVAAWGLNEYGQVGDGATTNVWSPFVIPSLSSGVNAVAGGAAHSLALQNGAVYAWGFNNYNQLGYDYSSPMICPSPVPVPGLSGGVTAIAAGGFHDLALQSGVLYAWGDNAYGDLGNGTGKSSPSPVPVCGLSSGVTAMAAGDWYSLAVQNGAVYGWGLNTAGQLGDGTTTNRLSPVPVAGLSSGVTAVVAGNGTSFAIKGGALYAWGDNSIGLFGGGMSTNSLTPVAVPSLSSGVSSVATGAYDQGIAVQWGKVYAWGAPSGPDTPTLVPGLNNIVEVAASWGCDFALSSDGRLWAWGSDGGGALGLGDTTSAGVPTQVLAPQGFVFTSVESDAVGEHVVATLTLAPEPSTLALLTCVTVGVLFHRRRPRPLSTR